MALTVVAKFEAKPGLEDRLRTELEAMIEPTMGEAGAISYEPYIDPNNARRMVIIEEWADIRALEDHFATPHLRHVAEVLAEILVEPFTLQLFTPSEEPAPKATVRGTTT